MANLNPVDSINLNSVPVTNFANHVPHLGKRTPIQPIEYMSNPNAYDSKFNQPRRYHPHNAPSSGSTTESFLKSRALNQPVFIHNEAKTKYAMISAISIKSSEIKHEEIRFV